MADAPTFVPELAARLHLIRDVPPRSLDPDPDEEARRAAFVEPLGPDDLPGHVGVTARTIDGPDVPIPVRIYTPQHPSAPRPALVWFHGGAFIGGSLDMPEAEHVALKLADRADAVVVSVDYRLTTEVVRFPAPHEDCWWAFRWVVDHADELGVDPARVAVGGASAGGNMAAGVALRSRDEGVPAWQALLAYPVVHPVLPDASPDLEAALALTPATLRFYPEAIGWMASTYLGQGNEPAPYAFAGIAPDLSNYPPTLIDNDEFDDLRASGEEFARQLAAAGVEVEVTLAAGVPHGHLNMIGLRAASESLDRFAARLRRS